MYPTLELVNDSGANIDPISDSGCVLVSTANFKRGGQRDRESIHSTVSKCTMVSVVLYVSRE